MSAFKAWLARKAVDALRDAEAREKVAEMIDRRGFAQSEAQVVLALGLALGAMVYFDYWVPLPYWAMVCAVVGIYVAGRSYVKGGEAERLLREMDEAPVAPTLADEERRQ